MNSSEKAFGVFATEPPEWQRQKRPNQHGPCNGMIQRPDTEDALNAYATPVPGSEGLSDNGMPTNFTKDTDQSTPELYQPLVKGHVNESFCSG